MEYHSWSLPTQRQVYQLCTDVYQSSELNFVSSVASFLEINDGKTSVFSEENGVLVYSFIETEDVEDWKRFFKKMRKKKIGTETQQEIGKPRK